MIQVLCIYCQNNGGEQRHDLMLVGSINIKTFAIMDQALSMV